MSFLDQFDKAARDVDKLRALFPECFNDDGSPVVAVLALPRVEPRRRDKDDTDPDSGPVFVDRAAGE